MPDLSAESKRKVTVLMFTDIVGYAAISHQNEPLALKLLEEHREIIRPIFTQFGGKEIKTIGDAFLTEFESALEATRCAIQIQTTLQNLNSDRTERETIWLRIGIHLGDIVYKEGDVYGDGVNITARLLFHCKPGGVCLSQYVFDQIDNKLNVKIKKLGVRPLKNISKPINVYLIDIKGTQYVKPTFQNLKNQYTRYAQLAMAGLTVLIAPYFWGIHLTQIRSGNQVVTVNDPTINKTMTFSRIAVLPFSNISNHPEDDYLSDGMTEELISHLSQLPSIRVLARTSTAQYKKMNKTPVEIGKELKVGAVIEGSVRKEGNKIRINIKLTHAATQENIWSYDFEGDTHDIFKTQKTIAFQISSQFKSRTLASIDPESNGNPDTTSYVPAHEAYVHYLRGRYFMNKRTEESILKAIEHLEKSALVDPKFALAYGALANCYGLLHYYEMISPQEAEEKIQKYVNLALKLDPQLPEALISLAEKKAYFDYEWDTANELFKKAIQTSPANARVRQWYGEFLVAQEKFSEAKTELNSALELDPLSLTAQTALALPDFYEKNYKKSIKQYLSTIEMDSSFILPYYWMGKAYIADQNPKPALEAFKKATELSKNNPKILGDWGYALAVSGQTRGAKKILEQLKNFSRQKYVSSFSIARIYMGLKDQKNTYIWLKKAVSEKSIALAFLKIDPNFNKLHSSPEFKEILNQLSQNHAQVK